MHFKYLGTLGKKHIFPFENPKALQKIGVGNAKCHKIATNAGHTAQNDGRTAQNDGRNTLYVCQGPRGGLRSPPGPQGPPPTPILEKTLVSRNDF